MFDYKRYLQSPAWQQRKAEHLAKHPACYCCGKQPKSVDLHHLSYRNVGREPYEDLVILCRKHHDKIHRLHKLHPHQPIAKLTIYVRDLCWAERLSQTKS